MQKGTSGTAARWAARLSVATVALALVGGVGLRGLRAQDTTPAAEPSRLSDTWQGDKLDPKWNVTLLGDAQDMENEVKVENGKLRLKAAGTDIWNDNDNGIFIWQPANGDFQVTLEHHSLALTDPSAKVGIMVRASLDKSSANSFLQVMPKGGAFQSRLTTADVSGPGSGCPGEECNPWGDPVEDDQNRPVILQRLTRVGKSMKAERSYDGGKTWGGLRTGSIADRDQAEIELPDDVLVGIAMTSHNTGTVGEAVVGPITFTQTALRPTTNGLVAALATDENGAPAADAGLEVLKGSDVLGTSVGEVVLSNTASFFLPPGQYTIRTAENDTYQAGTPVPFELTTGKVENLKVKVGAAK